MKLSISNIGWDKCDDDKVYTYLKEKGFNAIEVAPTILVGENPYDKVEEAKEKLKLLKDNYHFEISSMQSIWYGIKGNIFNTKDRKELLEYTKKAIDFAHLINCHNLVFGCPKNRIMPDVCSENDVINFFYELGEYALRNGTILSLEANPTIYGTNFINYTIDAFNFVKKVNSNGFKVNVDFGTIIANNEDLSIIENNISLINHIHISEPNLVKIQDRKKHKELFNILKKHNYDKYVSIEMKKCEDFNDLIDTINYVSGVFGEVKEKCYMKK